MKYFTFLPFLFFFASLTAQQAYITGSITDADTGEPLIASSIAFLKNKKVIHGTIANIDGKYSTSLPPATYDIEVSYTGYNSKLITDAVLKAHDTLRLDIALLTGAALDEIVVTGYKVPLIQQDMTTQGATINSSRKKASRRHSAALKKKRNKHKVKNKPPMSNTGPAAGQLTAGEWKDLDNWAFWKKLMGNWAFAKYKKHWGYYPDQRFSIKLSNEQGSPLANVRVKLIDPNNNTAWSCLTDNKGYAELWGNFFSGTADENDRFQLQIIQNEITFTFPATPYEEGMNSFSLPLDCNSSKQVDLAFVVDATNSMLDEIAYLKSEITDVLQRVEEENDIALRSGAVFYTDRHNPEPFFLTPLTEDHKKTIAFIQKQKNNSGGKEWAEAPDLGLAKAIREMKWNEEAIARIVFLLLDAPPHHNQNFLKDLQQTILQAADKGIKIIPIAASGIKKDAEFWLKFVAMATNGTYTFLTDHSGIGNKHIKPEAGDYNIETLNDLMVRLIGENSEYHDCTDMEDYVLDALPKKKLTRKEKRKKDIKAFIKKVKCFPNPANEYVFVEMKDAIDLLLITSSNAQLIQSFPKLKAGQVKINTRNWTAGTYYFHFYRKGKHIVEKIVVTHKS
ncbi:MAG TPA: VWA domain-containing protein [Phaeodactylibacter sp.]|nr:VWA domain-containing protein [Phaeodactylibacter sp.]